MNATNLTALFAVLVSLLASVCVPIYVLRRKERAEAVAAKIAEAGRVAAGTEVSWEAINKALARDRDSLRREIKDNAATYAREMVALRKSMLDEAIRVKALTDAEMERIAARLEYCQGELNRLYRELYGTQRPTPAIE